MKKTMKQLLSILLCLTLALCSLPISEKIVSAATGYDRGYNGSMAGDGKIYAHGLDVSAWQESGLNFQNFANAGYDYVILRCGTSYGKDKCFEEYYRNAKAAGLDVGCYYYSYAKSASEARAEANDMISWMGDKLFEYPIYFDYEDPSQSSISGSTAATICYAFMDTLKASGYLVGLYSMASWLEQSWVTTSGIRDTYEGWVAHLATEANNNGISSNYYNVLHSKYSTRYGMLQYSFTTYVNGAGPFDANVCYKDYPSIVKSYGFNGYATNDKEKPVISNVTYSNVSAAGYTISCKVTDDIGVRTVAFPTWTTLNGQDDLPSNFMTTQTGTKNGDIYTFTVKASDHNNEGGFYATHIYAQDWAGNVVSLAPPAVEVRNDTQGPTITDVVYSNLSTAGYTVSCKVTDDWGVSSVAFPTWTVANGQDDLADNFFVTQQGTKDGDIYTFTVKASDHNNETGMYATHIYATDCAGNRVSLPLEAIDVRDDKVNPVITDAKITNITSTGYTVSCKVTDDWGLNSVAFPTWTTANGQDDLAEQFMKTQQGVRDGDTYTFEVKISDHNNELGFYVTHIYARDCAGNTVSTELDFVEIKADTPSEEETTTQKPTVDETTKKPVEDDTTKKPAVDETTKKPVEDDTTKKPAVDETTKKPAVDETTKKPVEDDTTDKPVEDDTTKKPAVDETTKKPVEDDTTKKPAVDETTKKPVEDDTTKKPAVDETTKKPVEDDTTKKPAVDETTKKPVEDDTTDKPVEDDTTEKPAVDETTKKPVEDDTTKKPVEDDTTDKPVEDDTTKKPVEDEPTDKPLEDETTDKPAEDEPEADIVDAQKAAIVKKPTDATYNCNDNAKALSVEAKVTDDGTLTYQWYKNKKKNTKGATKISGATSNTYIPATEQSGTYYYYCIVTNTNTDATGKQVSLQNSGYAKVQVRKLANKITNVASSYKKSLHDTTFKLPTKANGTITYKTSNAKVATVSSDGIVTVTGIGSVKITITAGNTAYQTATKTVNIRIVPETVQLTTIASNGKKSLSVKWEKMSGISGFKIQYSLTKDFKNVKTSYVGSLRHSKTRSDLTAGKKYYVRVCAYKKIGKTTYQGAYSNIKSYTVK